MGGIKRAWAWFWANLSNIAMLVSWGMSFAIPAWAASTVELLKAYAPLSYILAGMVGLAVSGLAYMLIGIGSFWWTTAKIKASFYKERDRVNPLETVFRNQRIAIGDLVTPFEKWIEGKTFIDCELIGPANVLITAQGGGGSLSFFANTFRPTETVLIRDDADPPNAVVFSNCSFQRCRFFGVTLFFRENAYQFANRLIQGLVWITPTPSDPPQPELISAAPMPASEPESESTPTS